MSPQRSRAFDFDFRSPARGFSPPPCNHDHLDEVCSSSHSLVTHWRKEQAQALQLEAQRGIQDLFRDQEALEDLKADMAILKELTQAAQLFRIEGTKLGDAVRDSLKAASQNADEVSQTRDMLLSARDASRKELSRQEILLKEQQQASDAQAVNLEQFLSRYRNALGLDILRVAPRTVRLSFTLIDEMHPGREFSLVMGLLEEHVYFVQDCKPQVIDVSHLLRRLNEDPFSPAALPAFVCGLRRAFMASTLK
jgi:hypothetical protein